MPILLVAREAGLLVKRIYVANLSSLSEEHFAIEGNARYGGNIHPEDVKKILSGELK